MFQNIFYFYSLFVLILTVFSIDGEPGFNAQTLNFLREKVSKEDGPVLVSLLLDEMSLHKNVHFDGEKFTGGTGIYIIKKELYSIYPPPPSNPSLTSISVL